ncbi:MAG: glycosyltransferase family 4 protein [Lachnospiraceae bacterium]|nr:glycosyltransferase family 4 protein [Lachnospiraceae bacterium]
MRVLYIGADNPAVDTILNGMDDSTLSGLPAFYYPFKMLLERGCTIDLLLYTVEERDVVESTYFKKENLIQIHPRKNILPDTVDFFFQMSSAARKLLKARHYDFVYGMSEGAHLAVREAAKRGIPCGLRQYGTQEMANVLEPIKSMTLRRMKALKDYTYITLSMISKKTYILATNDGSRADELYKILGVRKKKFQFFFWRSGVYIPDVRPKVNYEGTESYPRSYDPLTLSMINRIADVKRQDRAARILGELHKRGYPFHLYLVGTDDSLRMHEATVAAAKEYGVEDYLHFEGGKSQKECRQYARNSFVTLLPCEWNRVNVFYEVMGEGAVVVTNDNHSIDEFIEDGVNCLVYEEDNFAQAAEKIIDLMHDSQKMESIRTAAHQTAKDRFMSLEKRFGLEAQLVVDAANGRNLNIYPSEI